MFLGKQFLKLSVFDDQLNTFQSKKPFPYSKYHSIPPTLWKSKVKYKNVH